MRQLKVNERIIEVLDKISISEIMLLRAAGNKEELHYLKGIYDAIEEYDGDSDFKKKQQILHQIVIAEPMMQSLVD